MPHGEWMFVVNDGGDVGFVAGTLHAITEPGDGGEDDGQVPPLLLQHCLHHNHLPLPTAHGNTIRPFQKVTSDLALFLLRCSVCSGEVQRQILC